MSEMKFNLEEFEKTRNDGRFKELQNATAEDLLGAAILAHEEDVRFAQGIEYALRIIAPEGWQEIAPVWLRKYYLNKHKQSDTHC